MSATAEGRPPIGLAVDRGKSGEGLIEIEGMRKLCTSFHSCEKKSRRIIRSLPYWSNNSIVKWERIFQTGFRLMLASHCDEQELKRVMETLDSWREEKRDFRNR
jgi:hypothetical protein